MISLFKPSTFAILATVFLTTSTTIFAEDPGFEECKTVTTVENFDIETYASAIWYSHQQAENSYSPIERNYCTTAQYTIKESPTFWGYTVGVNNEAEYASGISVGGDLCAYQTKKSQSKLGVAPCFLPKYFAGPYWIVAYDEGEGYALISGGQPSIPTENGLCKSGDGVNNSGLWIFSRSQERNETLISKVRSIAEEAGFDTSVLNDVDHTACGLCGDEGGTFDAGWFGEKTCDWVGEASWWRCWLYTSECPVTCGYC
jgi:lipocalin